MRAADLVSQSLKKFRKSINPPYEARDLLTIGATLLILIVIPLTALVAQQRLQYVSQAAVWRPTPGTTWQWQLTGTIDTSYNVQMYDIDLFDAPQSKINELKAAGRTVICYFSAGSWEDWRPDASQFPASVKGQNNGWPGEKWLDIRQLSILGPIMEARMDLAVQKGCHGLEPDNIDGWDGNNTGFPLTSNDQLTYNRWLATQAHERNLSIGLKNDLGQVNQLLNDFDWALDEECFEYDECEALLPFISTGKAVFNAEYNGNTSSFCPQANTWGFSSMKKRLDLDAWMEPCWTTTPPPSDTTPPTVSITSPVNGATVSGTVSITASATDNVGVTKVEFYVDSSLKSTDTSSPYSYSWNTTTVSNGTHTLVAKAYDAASNVGISSTITVTVNNQAAKPGDVNSDGVVNIFDLSILLSNWGTTGGAADINKDSRVDIFDLSILLTNWTG